MSQLYMVIDVESVGLHGEGFAVGWVVIDEDGKTHEEGIESCRPSLCFGSQGNHAWIRNDVPSIVANHQTSRSMRDKFWNRWIRWKIKGAKMVADCGWPVEARFLCQCIDDEREMREWDGPYPLLELSTGSPEDMADRPRLDNELPKHNPLCDARQSARLWIEKLKRSK
jgi:hypothetical protein